MRNRTYGGVRGRKTKVGEKLLRFPPTRFLFCTFVGDEKQLSLPTPYKRYWMNFETKKKNSFKKVW